MAEEQNDKRGEGAAVDKADRWIEIQALSAAIARLNRAPTEVESALCGAVVRARDWFEELEALKETASVPSHEREIYCHPCSEAGGAERGIYHLPPACGTTPSTTPHIPAYYIAVHTGGEPYNEFDFPVADNIGFKLSPNGAWMRAHDVMKAFAASATACSADTARLDWLQSQLKKGWGDGFAMHPLDGGALYPRPWRKALEAVDYMAPDLKTGAYLWQPDVRTAIDEAMRRADGSTQS